MGITGWVRIKIAHYISVCWWKKAGCKKPARYEGTVTYCKVREKSSAWIAPDLVMQLKHFKSRKSLPPKITCPQYNSDVDNALETCSSSKAIRSSLCPHSGQIQSYAAYARPHLITPRQSISISIVSIKGFQPHVMHSRHATDETVWPWSELQYKHRDITLM